MRNRKNYALGTYQQLRNMFKKKYKVNHGKNHKATKFQKEFESEPNKKDGERSFGTNENKCTV